MAPQQFEREEKMQLVQLLNSQVMIEDKRQYLLSAVRIYCTSLLNALQRADTDKIAWIEYPIGSQALEMNQP